MDDARSRSADAQLLAGYLTACVGAVLDLSPTVEVTRRGIPQESGYVAVGSACCSDPSTLRERPFAARTRSPLSVFVAAELHQLPFRCESFDHVVAFCGVKNIGALGRELQDVRRVLKSTGRLLLILEDMPLAERDRSVSPRDSNVAEPETHSGEVEVGRSPEYELWHCLAGRFVASTREWRGPYLVFELAPVAESPVPVGRRTPSLGDIRRVEPASLQFGFDRGTPIDRHYIEAFLLRNATFIRGRVLEVGDDTYTWRYGGDTVQISDVLHVSAGHARATVIGDLSNPSSLPRARYDCIICTQTLHLIFDIRTGVAALYQMLTPGGVLLATVPGISQISNDQWRDTWYWSLTPLAASRLIGDAFGSANSAVEAYGNVLAAISFLHGLAADELDSAELDARDPSYPVVIAIKAVKPAEPVMGWLEVTTVTQTAVDPALVDGAWLDVPRPGDKLEATAFRVQGWVAGHQGPANRVEVVVDGRAHGQVRVGRARPDVGAHLPNSRSASTSGFAGTVDLLGLSPTEIRIETVLADGQRAPLATLNVRLAWQSSAHPAEHDVVSVVIPCFNQAHYLRDAIESVIAQQYPKTEIVVIDDGSHDNTIEVVARYPGVTYVRQDNGGLSSARNLGLRRSNGTYVVFLDADDTLCPGAIAANLAHLRERPECAFVYGDFRHVGVDGSLRERGERSSLSGHAYAALLRGNHIGMHATVMYRRSVFQTVGVFDESLAACEDYDLYLRIARLFPISGHSSLVANYRTHAAAMSTDAVKMLRTSLQVLRRQWRYVRHDPVRRRAYKEGVRVWQEYYGQRVQDSGAGLNRDQRLPRLRAFLALARYAPRQLIRRRRRG